MVNSSFAINPGVFRKLPFEPGKDFSAVIAFASVPSVIAVPEHSPIHGFKDLIAAGFAPELIRAACAEHRLIRISPDVVVTPEFEARAQAIVATGAKPPGMTVSAFREALGTSRKYALPILEYFDAKGVTKRQGDVRLLR